MIAGLKEFADRLLGRGDATITVPSFDGALKPNQILEKAETVAQLDAPEDLATDGKALYIADGAAIRRLDGAQRHRGAALRPHHHRAVLPAGRRHRGRARRARGAGLCDAVGGDPARDLRRSLDECDQRAVAGAERNADRDRRLDRATLLRNGCTT